MRLIHCENLNVAKYVAAATQLSGKLADVDS